MDVGHAPVEPVRDRGDVGKDLAMKRAGRVALRLTTLLVVGICALTFACGACRLFGHWYDMRRIRQLTTPLEPAVVQDLCQKLSLPKGSRLCQPGAAVYAPEFYPAIHSAIKRGVTTYDEVQYMLGAYQVEREPPVGYADGAIFSCTYDLRGDGMFHFGISFREDGRVHHVIAQAFP